MSTILVVSPNWLGDAIMCMPAVQALRVREPEARIGILARHSVRGIWGMHTDVDVVISAGAKGRAEADVLAGVRAFAADRAVVLPNSFRSAVIPWRARIEERVGVRGQGRGWLLTRRLARSEWPGHQARDMFRRLELEEPEGAGALRPRLRVPEEATPTAMQGRRWVGMVPGAARGPSKRWPLERVAAVGRRVLEETDLDVLLLGTGADAAACADLVRELGDRSLSVAGETNLAGFVSALAGCEAVLANDSGGAHVAAAVGTPLVVVFGATDPSKTAPLAGGDRRGLVRGVDRVEVVQRCERVSREVARDSDAALKALEAVSVADVWEALTQVLGD